MPFPVTPIIPPHVISGQVISAGHENQTVNALDALWMDLQWLATQSVADLTTAKGDMMVRGASSLSRLPIGADNQVLVADSAQAVGMKWTALYASAIGAVPDSRQVIAGAGMSGGGPLSSDVTLTANVKTVFGRTGDVVLTSADIASAGGVPATRTLTAGTGLTGGGDLSADRTFAVVPDTTVQRIRYSYNGTLVGTRREVNLIPGANVTISVTDNPTDNRIDVTVAAAGGGAGGMIDPTTTLGDLIVRGSSATTRLGVGTNSYVLTADSTAPLGIAWKPVTGGGSGTPAGSTGQVQWNNAGAFGASANLVWISSNPSLSVGNDGSVLPDAGTDPRLIVGQTTADLTKSAQVNLIANKNSAGVTLCSINFANYAITATEKRIAAINCGMESAINSGWMSFFTWNAGTVTEKMRITAAGNVGIGTATPAGRLTVSNNAAALLAPSANTLGHFGGIDGTQARLLLDAYGANAFYYVRASGGTAASPTALALGAYMGGIVSTGRGATVYNEGTAFIGFVAAENFTDTHGGTDINFITTGTAGAGSGERMRITADGFVGIGTYAPGALLEVHSPLQNIILAHFTANTGNPANIHSAGIALGVSTAQPFGTIYGQQSLVSSYSDGLLMFQTRKADTLIERMRITADGAFGFCTPTPNGLFEVQGNVAGRVNITFSNAALSAAGNRIRLRLGPSNGFIPSDLHPYVESFNEDSSQTSGLGFGTYRGVDGLQERMRIAASGNVGIGNSAPGYKLDVNGDVNCTGSFRVNGLNISQITTQNVVTGSRSLGTNYQNTQAKAMAVTVVINANSGNGITASSDATSTPSQVVASVANPNATGATMTITFWVLSGNWYKVAGGTVTIVSWIEWC